MSSVYLLISMYSSVSKPARNIALDLIHQVNGRVMQTIIWRNMALPVPFLIIPTYSYCRIYSSIEICLTSFCFRHDVDSKHLRESSLTRFWLLYQTTLCLRKTDVRARGNLRPKVLLFVSKFRFCWTTCRFLFFPRDLDSDVWWTCY